MQMTACTAADRHPLSMPLTAPSVPRISSLLLVTRIHAHPHLRMSLRVAQSASQNIERPRSNISGNELRAPALAGDMDGESSGIRRFQLLKALDNPC